MTTTPTPPSVQGLAEHLRTHAKFLDEADFAIAATMHRSWASAVESLESQRIAPEGQAAQEWLSEADRLTNRLYDGDTDQVRGIRDSLLAHLRKRIAAPQAVPAQADMTDARIEELIAESGGAWHEDVFHIGGPELMRLARAILSARKDRE